jgi:hypothetical protein
MKTNYIFVKPYYWELRDIVESKNTVLEYKPNSDNWETDNKVYGAGAINYLLKNGYIKEHKPNQLTFDQYLQIMGVDNNNATAVTIWKTLEQNGYYITKNLVVADDPPIEQELNEIPF